MALSYITKALDIETEISNEIDRTNRASTLLNLGVTLSAMHKHKEAKLKLLEAI